MKRRYRNRFSGEDPAGFQRQVNARLPAELRGVIVRRAHFAGITAGGYLASIALSWLEQGAPPVTDYEARLLATARSTASLKDQS